MDLQPSGFRIRELKPNFEEYLSQLSRSGTAGDVLVLVVAAEVFSSNIWVISSVDFPQFVLHLEPVGGAAIAQRNLFLCHYLYSFYGSLAPTRDVFQFS